MILVIQRVSSASVVAAGVVHVSKIGKGALILLGVEKGDGEKEVDWCARKFAQLRIFSDPSGKMNLSIKETGGQALLVSQFTLLADCHKGNRPGFERAAPPGEAETLYQLFRQKLEKEHQIPTFTGVFQTEMEVSLVNQGPVTIILERRNKTGP